MSALLAGTATWLVVSAVVPHPVEAGVPVVVVVHDLALGARVGADDVRLERRPASERPLSAVPRMVDAVGQVTAGPVGEGELLTTTRFRGPAALAGLAPARVAVSIPLVDDGLLPVLSAGDRVTVLTPGTGASIATAAPVLSVSSPDDGGAGLRGTDVLGHVSSGGTGARVVLGLTAQEATSVAAAMGGASGLTGFVLALRGD
ncbi:MAG: SAF domain-containing protein [Actinomycetota bacterium]|nr:SAF domain-containing protein [Actinomycetota bacterium]